MPFNKLNLHPEIHKAIKACGYVKPTPIQAQSIPHVLSGRDIVATAQTGTGKTAAYVLPALHHLGTRKTSGKPRVLILTPTRELANQITQVVGTYGKFMRFNTVSLVGGMSYHHQIRGLSNKADIIVATPGRLIDHMNSKRLDLSGIEILVLDEADRMLDMGFIDVVKKIAAFTPKNRQTLLFSATVDNSLKPFIQKFLKDPIEINLSVDETSPDSIKQELYLADSNQHKEVIFQNLIANKSIFKAIIFCATKIHTSKLATKLRDQGFAAAALHGDLKQNVRNKTLAQLRQGKIQFLVATDVAARGIDVMDISHIINYDLPKFPESYVHRIGRTGRAGKEGIAISFATPTDIASLKQIERYIGKKINRATIEGLEPKNDIESFQFRQPRKNKKSSHGGRNNRKGTGGWKGERGGQNRQDGRDGARSGRDGAKNSSYGRDERNGRRDNRDGRDKRDGKNANTRGGRNAQDTRRDTRDMRDVRDTRDTRDGNTGEGKNAVNYTTKKPSHYTGKNHGKNSQSNRFENNRSESNRYAKGNGNNGNKSHTKSNNNKSNNKFYGKPSRKSNGTKRFSA